MKANPRPEPVTVVVHFTERVEGPLGGSQYRNDWHSVTATGLLRQGDDMVFVREDEVVERWPADLIARVEWFPAGNPTPTTTPRRPPAYTLDDKRKQHRQAYLRWTPEEEQLLAEGVEEGLSLAELAERHARNEGAITSRLARLGLSVPDNEPATSGEPSRGSMDA